MPLVRVEYSEELAPAFDRQGFARDLHATVPPLIDATTAAFKTRFHRIEESYLGAGERDIAAVLIQLAILSGRTPEQKAALSEAVLDLVRKHVAEVPGVRTHFSVEVRDMDRDSYRAHKV
ncbi:5-carboxymethyl-2-hydroxymuconate Delta-isomerase [Streptomyces sp. GC420]|uniref:5-carboxymethyl-2-hydroxymuconate Delta-isomerase n=1 Tax=Streptomyces sp. GC420 TaxID=2697568 RepID=UPI00141510CB|nr:isomerase [Streptomyces sp. GC420]NBM16542.1 isomerase [Streptomyces sp. GC420]